MFFVVDRHPMHEQLYADESELVHKLIVSCEIGAEDRQRIASEASALVKRLREDSRPGLMEAFLSQYGLDTEEGVALMSLAEALLRVPDAATVDALIQDKVGGADWSRHQGGAQSPLVGFAAFALDLTSKVLGAPDVGPRNALHRATARLGEPVIRLAVSQAMRILGGQFVFARTIEEAAGRLHEGQGGKHYSFDMLGEAARTHADAGRYFDAYRHAIEALAPHCTSQNTRDNPGISVKLSALHPRYEVAQRQTMMPELVRRTVELARAAAQANMGFNIDAEEADRLDLSLDVVEALLAEPALSGWDRLGVVVQAYGKRALPLIDWLQESAARSDRRIMVRLVKGAYWDAEIKRAQVMGLPGYPVFTRKAATDVSYIAAARRLFASPHLYPQFAGHNAHTTMAILHLAKAAGHGPQTYELQRLHGMGEALHALMHQEHGTMTRIYAPVGPHKDLLAYLVRRLLENGANGSFVHQIADADISPERVAEDPIAALLSHGSALANPAIPAPAALFGGRRNSTGLDPADPIGFAAMQEARAAFGEMQWHGGPLGAGHGDAAREVINPANTDDSVGLISETAPGSVAAFVGAAHQSRWSGRPVAERARLLMAVADLYEANRAELFALLAREAGKTWPDAIAEVREAVDFLRYYAGEAEALTGAPRGPFVCISPWNFPLAIFTGQVAAALAAGNPVLAKPAPQTPLIAFRAVQLMHEAGIDNDAVQLLPGGADVGATLVSTPGLGGVAFTGSLGAARRIEQAIATHQPPDTPLIAETGGLNAMIVDSTALTEQAVRDILASAFQSAGQRCSALRVLYVQEDAADRTLDMLKGAMHALVLGDPWALSTDIGPVIDLEAHDGIADYVAARRGQVLHQVAVPEGGIFFPPTLISVGGIADIPSEVFGPVLHVARFAEPQLDAVVAAIKASGYGLTFGLHTRITTRIRKLSRAVHAGNIYVNRNQIGAVVGSQPFGGEGLSGTGPKAGGPAYLPRFTSGGDAVPLEEQALPGPTGESNVLHHAPRGTLLCLGPRAEDMEAQVELAESTGNRARVDAVDLAKLEKDLDFDAVAWFGDAVKLGEIRRALSRRDGPLLPLISRPTEVGRLLIERHVCIDTTAAGGNASLMAEIG